MAGIGATLATITTVVDTAQPKKTTEITSDLYRPADDTRAALETFYAAMQIVSGKAGELFNRHNSLFTRTVRVEWKTDHQESYQDCSRDSNGNSTCVTKYRTVTRHHDREETINIDQDMRNINAEYLGDINTYYGKALGSVGHFRDNNLKLLEGELGSVDWLKENSDEFAANFTFHWTEGNVSTGWQTAIATAIGLPATALFLFYGNLVDMINGHRNSHFTTRYRLNDYLREKSAREDRDEMKLTRRSLLQVIGGAGAATLAFGGKERYEKRSEEIRAEGEKGIRNFIIRGNKLDEALLFLNFFNNNPEDIIKELETYAYNLRLLTFEEIDLSVRNGLIRLDEEERKIRHSADFGAYSIRTTRKDDNYNPEDIRNYLSLAHSVADEIDSVLDGLKTFFKEGVPKSLLPAMRACYITDGVNSVVSHEHSRHMWGLAGDLGILYGSALVLLLASEINGAHHKAAYNLVQGMFDFVDRRKLSAFEIVSHLKGSLSYEEKNAVFGDEEIVQAVKGNIAALKKFGGAYTETGVVFAPVRDYLGRFERKARDDLNRQIEGLSEEAIIDLYIEKALVFFARKQLSPKGLMQAMKEGKSKGGPVSKPNIDELKGKVAEFIKEGEQYFIFDLIDAGLIDDNEPEEDWLTTESSDLRNNINYWADRILGYFTSSQSMQAALGILPLNWSLMSKEGAQTLSREEVLTAFVEVVRGEINSTKEKSKIKKEIESALTGDSVHRDRPARSISDEEIANRVLLRKLKETAEAHKGFDVLSENEPRLKAALAEAVQNI